MSALSVLQQRAFSTGRFDVGNLTQAVWSTAHGRFLEVTDLQGRADLAPRRPLRPARGAARAALVALAEPRAPARAQAVAVALGAVPVFLLARKHLGSEGPGSAFALVYLLYPPTQWLVVDDFHPVAFATPLLLGAIWFLDEDRLLPFALCAGAACLTKEQIGLVVAMLGVWHAFAPRPAACRGGDRRRRCPRRRRRDRARRAPLRARRRIAVRGPLRRGRRVARRDREDGPDASRAGSSRRWPSTVTSLPLRPPLAARLAAVALPARGPERAAGAAPQPPLEHANADLDPLPLHGRRDSRDSSPRRCWRRPASGGAGPGSGPPSAARSSSSSLLAGVVLGPLPVWRHVPFGSDLAARDGVVSAHDRAAARVLRAIPPAAAVSATNTLGAHLSARRRIFSFPVLGEARWVAVDLKRPSYLDDARGPEVRRRLCALPAGRPLAASCVRRTASSCCAASVVSGRDRLREQIRAERQAADRGRRILLGRRERDRPGEVPDRQVRRRQEDEAGGEAEARAIRVPPGGRASARPATSATTARPSASGSGRPSCSRR